MMIFPAITAFYAAILALIFAILSGWVIAGRFSTGILHGAGDDTELLRRTRAHGNFSEYVPFIVILVGLYEASGGAQAAVRWLLIILTASRLMHPIGMIGARQLAAAIYFPRRCHCCDDCHHGHRRHFAAYSRRARMKDKRSTEQRV